MSLIIEAAQFAAEKHKGQFRKYNNFPYITHPIRVAGRMATHQLATQDIVAAAYLHDVVEDCGVSPEEIRAIFGESIEFYVKHLTNPPREEGVPRRVRKQQDRERLKTAPRRAKVVKLIDRIDNLRELDWSDSFAKVYAEESLLLLEVLKDADQELAEELRQICHDILQ